MSDKRDLYAELLPLLDSPSRDPVGERPPSGDRAWSFCPSHADGTKHGKRSLSLHPSYGLDCFAGCAFRDIVRALRERAGIHPAHPAPSLGYSRNGSSKGRREGRIVATWGYFSEDNRALFRVLRKEWPDGYKEFFQQHPSGSGECCGGSAAKSCKPADAGWRWKRDGARYVLYGLPQLLAADPAELVFLVEGEKCADALRSLGLLATTAPGGAKAVWQPGYTDTLRGRRVVILPDSDGPGVDYAEGVSKALAGVASKVLILTLPGLPPKGDVVDWLANGGSREALLKPVYEALP